MNSGTSNFVFDTYALVEIFDGNKKYAKYVESFPIINDFIFSEFVYYILRTNGIKNAIKYAEKYAPFIVKLSPAEVIESAQFKLNHKKKRVSFTDAAGYIQARKYDVKFLTGDRQFKNMDNVEYVK